MAAGALYFPYVVVPDSDWFTRVLLYWDEVGAIVPSDLIREPERLGPHMVGLVHAQLVRQVQPLEYVHRAPRFEEGFLQFIESRQPRRRGARPTPTAALVRIHMEKLGRLPDELVKRGLAEADHYPWYRVERDTALHFMAYLAGIIGKIEDGKYVPVTDQIPKLSGFGSSITESTDTVIHELRPIILNRALPAPSPAPGPDELARFKSRYHAQLRRYRLRIESLVSEIAAIPEEYARATRLENAMNEIAGEHDEIRIRMNQARWRGLNFGTVCSLVGAFIPGVQAVATGNQLAGATAVATVAAAVYFAVRAEHGDSHPVDRPLAYAAIVERKLRGRQR